MPQNLGKIGLEELRKFLERRGCLWEIGDRDFRDFVSHVPQTTDELMDSMVSYGGNHLSLNGGDVYLFGNEEVDEPMGIDEARQLDAESIGDFVINCVRGRDFLWIACTPEEVSNGTYVTLVPVEDQSEVEQEAE